jgi:hypothetical protein
MIRRAILLALALFAARAQAGDLNGAGVTPTPPPVVIGPTEAPAAADAKILGNKFNPSAGGTVGFKVTLPYGGTLHIDIYDRMGRRLKSVIKEGGYGDNFESWDGRDDGGALVPAGIYAVRFQGKGLIKVAKLVVIK